MHRHKVVENVLAVAIIGLAVVSFMPSIEAVLEPQVRTGFINETSEASV